MSLNSASAGVERHDAQPVSAVVLAPRCIAVLGTTGLRRKSGGWPKDRCRMVPPPLARASGCPHARGWEALTHHCVSPIAPPHRYASVQLDILCWPPRRGTAGPGITAASSAARPPLYRPDQRHAGRGAGPLTLPLTVVAFRLFHFVMHVLQSGSRRRCADSVSVRPPSFGYRAGTGHTLLPRLVAADRRGSAPDQRGLAGIGGHGRVGTTTVRLAVEDQDPRSQRATEEARPAALGWRRRAWLQQAEAVEQDGERAHGRVRHCKVAAFCSKTAGRA